MRRIGKLTGWVAAACWLAAGGVGAEPTGNIRDDYAVKTLARGLKTPDGIAIHPSSGEIYLTEKEAGRVSVIRNGQPVPVLSTGWSMVEAVPNWAITQNMTRQVWSETRLRNPGGLAFGTNGHLYVVEDAPMGRLLEFMPDANGQFSKAKAVPIPWLDRGYAWQDLKVARDGRMVVVGNVAGGPGEPKFGVVLQRDPSSGDWWVVDYGPFVEFSSVCFSKKQDILAVAERPEGGLAWWDIMRHLPIGTANQITPGTDLDGLALLKDGAFVLGEQATANKPGQLSRLDPLDGSIVAIAQNFGALGSVIFDDAENRLLATDAKSGVLIECRPKDNAVVADAYLLQRSLEGYEMAQGFTPRSSPAFLMNFFAKAGVSVTTKSKGGQGAQFEGKKDIGRMAVQFTLKDFASKIPLVAGRLRTTAPEASGEADPVVQLDFVLLFPGRAVISGGSSTPSLSFFAVKRKSGKMEQTRQLFSNMNVTEVSEDADAWRSWTDNASLYVPLVSCGIQKGEGGVHVNLVFLGLGVYDDYYVNLFSGEEDRGTLIVENDDGERFTYDTTFKEVVQDTEVRNLVVAGFDPQGTAGIGWLNIGQWPVGASVGLGEMDIGRFAGVSEDLARLLENKEAELRFESGLSAIDFGRPEEPGGASDVAETNAPPPAAASTNEQTAASP